ncbi:MAG: flagellar motor switch protein FliG [Spirochaetales bacterium]
MDPKKRQIEAYQKVMHPPKTPLHQNSKVKDASRSSVPTNPAAPFTDPSSPQNPSPPEEHKASKSFAGLFKVTGKENPYRKAAKFLLLVGKEEGAKVLRHFTEEEVEKITRELSQIKRVDPVEAEHLLKEFGFFKQRGKYVKGGVKGGIETARSILTKAFGEELGRSILARSVPLEEQKLFAFLQDMEAHQVFQLLRTETPAVVAVLIPFLKSEQASQLIQLFEPEFRTRLLIRLAHKDKVSREVLIRMEEALREKAHRFASPAAEVEVDGKSVLADILKYMDLDQEEKILKELEEEAPEVADDLKERLFTIDVLEDMEDQDLQKVLRTLSEKDIALLLKGKTENIRFRILSNISERRRLLVTEEYRYLGAVPKKEVDKATKDFLDTLKRLEQEGKIVLRRRGELLFQ